MAEVNININAINARFAAQIPQIVQPGELRRSKRNRKMLEMSLRPDLEVEQAIVYEFKEIAKIAGMGAAPAWAVLMQQNMLDGQAAILAEMQQNILDGQAAVLAETRVLIFNGHSHKNDQHILPVINPAVVAGLPFAFPALRGDLFRLNGAQCNQLINYYGIPLHQGANVDAKRMAIATRIGLTI